MTSAALCKHERTIICQLSHSHRAVHLFWFLGWFFLILSKSGISNSIKNTFPPIPGKVVDLPRPKPFQVIQAPAASSISQDTNCPNLPKVELEDKPLDDIMLLETGFDSYHVSNYYNYNVSSLPSPILDQPSPSFPSPSTNSFFQFPPAPYNDCSSLIKHEQSQ